MSNTSWKLRTACTAFVATGTLGLMLAAAPAAAQGYGSDEDTYASDENGPEQVEVTAPRFYQEPDRHIGIPGRVSLSQAVTYDDLNLQTRRGARELRARVRETADEICYRLDEGLPGTGDDHGTCYRETVNRGLAQARAAVSRARYAEEE
jgi:UrcA family protein